MIYQSCLKLALRVALCFLLAFRYETSNVFRDKIVRIIALL